MSPIWIGVTAVMAIYLVGVVVSLSRGAIERGT